MKQTPTLKKTLQPALLTLGAMLAAVIVVIAQPDISEREFYELREYHISSEAQKKQLTDYLKNAEIPALNRLGIKAVGVFEEIEPGDEQVVYMFIPFNKLEDVYSIHSKLMSDKKYVKAAGTEYLEAPKDKPAFTRIKSSLLVNFVSMPAYDIPDTKAPKSERVYELRSYQSYSENKGLAKIHMFDEGGETEIFKRLGFNAVFYSQALIGHERPNLVYMTTFDNMDDRNKHWDSFRTDAAWDKLKVKEEYKDTVSKNNTHLLRPMEFSQI